MRQPDHDQVPRGVSTLETLAKRATQSPCEGVPSPRAWGFAGDAHPTKAVRTCDCPRAVRRRLKREQCEASLWDSPTPCRRGVERWDAPAKRVAGVVRRERRGERWGLRGRQAWRSTSSSNGAFFKQELRSSKARQDSARAAQTAVTQSR